MLSISRCWKKRFDDLELHIDQRLHALSDAALGQHAMFVGLMMKNASSPVSVARVYSVSFSMPGSFRVELSLVLIARPPFVELRLQQEERRGVADEIQDAHAVEADTEEGVQRHEDQREGEPHPCQGQDREQQPQADQDQVPQLPEPEGRFRGHVFGVIIQLLHLQWVSF